MPVSPLSAMPAGLAFTSIDAFGRDPHVKKKMRHHSIVGAFANG
jgi:hypothetical protein